MARLGRRQPNRPIIYRPRPQVAAGNPTVREYLDNSTDGPSFNLISGSGTAVDDVLVVFHAADAGAASAMTTPTGTAGTWTQVELADLGTGNTHLKLWMRPVTAGGAQTVTISSNTGDNGAMLYVIAGADPANPVDGSANTTGTASTSHVAASVSPTSTAALLLATVASEVLTSSSYSAVSGGMTNLTEEDVSALGIFFTLGTARQNLSASGATGTRTFTYGASKAFAAITVAIKPAAGGISATAAQTITATQAAGLSREAPIALAQTITAAQTAAALREARIAAAQTITVTQTADIVKGPVIAAAQTVTVTQNLAALREAPIGASQALTATSTAGIGRQAPAVAAQTITAVRTAGLTLAAIAAAASTITTTQAADMTVLPAYIPARVSVDASTGSSGLEATTSTGTLDGATITSGALQ